MSSTDTATPDVVRATRVELVDRDGAIRAVLGQLDTPDPDQPVYGLALLDQAGHQRAWLALDTTGPNLVFDLAGNNLLSAGVNDAVDDALQVGAYLHLADLDGRSVFAVAVEEDGSVLARLGGGVR